MGTYLHPGVYVEQVAGGARSIEPSGTSTPVFLGALRRGPRLEPVRVTSYEAYQEVFGRLGGSGVAAGDVTGLSLRAFFINGGRAAYVMRVTQKGSTPDEGKATVALVGRDDSAILTATAVNEGAWGNDLRLRLEARSDEREPEELRLSVGREEKGRFVPLETFDNLTLVKGESAFVETKVNGTSKLVTVKVAAPPPSELAPCLFGKDAIRCRISGSLAGFDVRKLNKSSLAFGETKLAFPDSAFAESAGLKDVVNELNKLLETAPEAVNAIHASTLDDDRIVLSLSPPAPDVTIPSGDTLDACALLRLHAGYGGMVGPRDQVIRQLRIPLTAKLDKGVDSNAGALAEYEAAFARLEREREVSIVCLPDCPWDPSTTKTQIVESAIAHAEKTMNRMVIVDPPKKAVLNKETDFTALRLGASSYAVLYYPWLRIPNPSYVDGSDVGADEKTLLVPPCGFAAGLWARTDARRGVWKAPAGVEARLVGVAEPEIPVDDANQDVLNRLGVNCLREIPGAGYVVWGARTQGTRMEPEWRYVPVRRTALMIGESIRNGIQWAVFEPNDASLWRLLRVNVEAFMNSLFRAGAFQGTTARQAYFVRCGLDDGTMTQDNINRGEIVVLVGFAPVKPAEFVIVRVQQAESTSSVSIAS